MAGELLTANVVFPAFRNSICGDTSNYTTRVNLDTDTLYAYFVDETTVAVLETMIFNSALTAGEAPAYASRLDLTSTTVPSTETTAAAGFFDAADATFTGGSAIAATTTTYEKLIIAKRQASAATDPLLYHFGTATGLAITPNGADITVVWNASGIARH
jgi:hypothetical protein